MENTQTMTVQPDELGEGLNESYRAHRRAVAIRHLAARRHLTLGQIAKLCDHEDHGEAVSTITLQDLVDDALKELQGADEEEEDTDDDEEVEEEEEEETEAPRSRKKRAKKTAKKKVAKKAAKKTAKAAKKTAKKAAKKTAKKAAKASSGNGKADKGKPKPRLDYEQGTREVLSALKAAASDGTESLGRSALEKVTGFTGVQVRAFVKKLVADGKVQVLGEGGRSTTYALA